MIPTHDDVEAAARTLEPHVHRTPVLTSRAVDERTDARVCFKCENFQRAGAFKFRGACNAVFSLPDEGREAGVATHSSGNHAQALALAASIRGIPAHVVMPENAPRVKVNAVRGYGGRITFCEPTLEAREATLETVVEETGARTVHPYDDPRVIAGQGTAALELLHEHPELDLILGPVGGGGLMSGTAIAATLARPQICVVGVEPAAADDAFRSLQEGSLQRFDTTRTVADGLRTHLSERTFRILSRHLDGIVTVDEQAIVDAMRFVWERMKIVIEASAAVPVAALLDGTIEGGGKRIGVIVSGGNVDLDRLPWQG